MLEKQAFDQNPLSLQLLYIVDIPARYMIESQLALPVE
jgi:hypothetical protein